jgi:hypothetical protein
LRSLDAAEGHDKAERAGLRTSVAAPAGTGVAARAVAASLEPAWAPGRRRRGPARPRLAGERSSLWSRLSPRGRAAALIGLAGVLGALGIESKTAGRVAVGALGLVILVAVAVSGRRVALALMIAWLVLLGFVRRLLIPIDGYPTLDPLLLVSPAGALVLWYTRARGPDAGPPPRRTLLSATASFLLLLSIAEIFNPLQGSLKAGAEGSIFYVVPLLWFLAGRRLDASERDLVLDTVVWMTLPVLLSGYYQSLVGFLPFELHWLAVSHQSPAVFLPGFHIRPFSTLVSPQEYGIFLSISAVVVWSRLLHGERPRLAYAPLFAATVVALFLQASRGAFAFFLLALIAVTVLRAWSAPVALVSVASVLAVAVLLMAHGGQGGTVSGSSAVSAEVGHELQLFENPTGGTVPTHIKLIEAAVSRGLHQPLGYGVSTGTIAALKTGTYTIPSAESDLGNTFQGLGLSGGIGEIVLVLASFAAAVRFYRRAPTARHLAWIGILVAALDQWLNGALYCTSTIVFLVLGGLAAQLGEERGSPASMP